jgi:hypothetical protein
MDTDGFISHHAAGINLANAELIDDIRQLCLQIGLVTKKYYLPREGFGSWVLEFDHHGIERLAQLPLRLKYDRIERLVRTARYSLIDCYPQSVACSLPEGVNRKLRREIGWKPSYANGTVTRDKIQRAMSAEPLPLWKWLEEADVFWDEIIDVTHVGTRMTYDIEVQDTHNFIANGLVTHNSTVARRIAVMDAVLSHAYGKGGYCLYFSGTDDKTNKHALSINQLLTSKAMRKWAPELTRVKRSEEGSRSLGWKATFFYTEAGYVYHFGSLQSGLAGGNVDDLRPTLLLPDDIDDRKDSAAIAEANARAFTHEILPMGKTGTLTLFAQNLISRFSVMYRIHKGTMPVLTNRRPSSPVPAVENFEVEYRTEGGITKPFIDRTKHPRATWPAGMPLEACEEELQRVGEAAFRAELQHEVERPRTGLMHKRYDDAVHPISLSEFAAVFGSRDAWKDWFKIVANDWARTKTKYHANVGAYLAVSSANSPHPGLTIVLPRSFAPDSDPADVAAEFLTMLTPYAYGTNGDRRTWRQLIKEAWRRTNAQQHFETVSERLDFERNYYERLIPKYSRPILQQYRVAGGAMSHSEDKVRELFNAGFGFAFQPANPGKLDALEQIDEAMRVDYDLPHLFRPGVKGYTRWYILCEDDKSEPPTIVNGVEVYPPPPFPDALEPDNLDDADLCRFQMANRRFREPKMTASGELIDEPEKILDDFGQLFQMVYFKGLLSNIRLTADERKELHLPPKFRRDAIERAADAGEMDERERSQALLTREVQLNTVPRILGRAKAPAAKSRFSKFKK